LEADRSVALVEQMHALEEFLHERRDIGALVPERLCLTKPPAPIAIALLPLVALASGIILRNSSAGAALHCVGSQRNPTVGAWAAA
jgi:hypothetical protein